MQARKKKWFKPKGKLKVTFAGEPAVDDGVPKHEFFTGTSFFAQEPMRCMHARKLSLYNYILVNVTLFFIHSCIFLFITEILGHIRCTLFDNDGIPLS